MVMYAKVRRMFFREHVSISEIGRRTSLSRNTIKKWLRRGFRSLMRDHIRVAEPGQAKAWVMHGRNCQRRFKTDTLLQRTSI